MKAQIYFNPRCSKARGAHTILLEKGFDLEVIEYLKHPPSKEEIVNLLTTLAVPVRDLIRTGEAEYKSLGLEDSSLSDDTLIEAIVKHPRLLQRPIVVIGTRAVIARPPERLLEILP